MSGHYELTKQLLFYAGFPEHPFFQPLQVWRGLKALRISSYPGRPDESRWSPSLAPTFAADMCRLG